MVVVAFLQKPQVWILEAWIKQSNTIPFNSTLISYFTHTLKWLLPFTVYFSESAIDKLIVRTVCELSGKMAKPYRVSHRILYKTAYRFKTNLGLNLICFCPVTVLEKSKLHDSMNAYTMLILKMASLQT